MIRIAIFVIAIVCYGLPLVQGVILSSKEFKQFALGKLREVRRWAENYLTDRDLPYQPSEQYPYWNFMPMLSASVFPTGKPVQWNSKCFKSNVATAKYTEDRSAIVVSITSSSPIVPEDERVCEDVYATMTSSAIVFTTGIFAEKNKPITSTEIILTLPVDLTDAEAWDITHKGVRLLRFPNNSIETYSNILKTITIFLPEFSQHVSPFLAEKNREFLENYTNFQFGKRNPFINNKIPKESEIHSGDSFYIQRMDGSTPLLGWAMGATTGHVVTALWIENELYIVESTTVDDYWPTNGIQKTPYRTWIQQSIEADFIVVYAKLNDENRLKYNTTAVIDFFKQNEGFDYGYQTLIWPWLDTLQGNFPCLPPDFSSNCMTWTMLEPLIAVIDRLVPEIGDSIWNAGLAKRVSLPDDRLYRTSEIYQEAEKKGITTNELITIPEQDSWRYNITRYDEPSYGRSLVCCVFVCNTWKEAGLFDDLTSSINCGESTIWDNQALTIHDSYEQILGNYDLSLNDFRTKNAVAHMGEACPALPPDYDDRTADC